jgi:hypothetical protein
MEAPKLRTGDHRGEASEELLRLPKFAPSPSATVPIAIRPACMHYATTVDANFRVRFASTVFMGERKAKFTKDSLFSWLESQPYVARKFQAYLKTGLKKSHTNNWKGINFLIQISGK